MDELLAYVSLGDEDQLRLRALHPLLEPRFPEIAVRFYEAVWRSPGASGVLKSREQIERLRVTLVDWMSTGLMGPYDDRFYEKRSRIGRRHVAIGLGNQYMFTAMNVVRLAYHEHIAVLCGQDAAATSRAVNKLLDIELAIMVQHYQLDSEEKLVARERLGQAERITAIQTMTSGIAHEVRNPLNAAKLQLELLERRLRRRGNDEQLTEPCQLAQREIDRLTLLLNDFLSFARPPELHLGDACIGQILVQVVELERVAAERRGAELVLVTCPMDLVARVDAGKIHQIVLNLVRNAVEAVSAGGHVTVELAADDASFRIRIQDDGLGIPVEARHRIYEPFFSTKETGTGLGMSIVHSLVTLHGGSIDLDTSSRGTRFDVHIPRTL